MMLSIQNIDGETTLFALSDITHCTRILAEKRAWAKKPMMYMYALIRGGLRFYVAVCHGIVYISFFSSIGRQSNP